MNKLFADSTEKPKIETVRLLEGYGYKAEKVKQWSAAKAEATLDAVKKEEAIALARATEKARALDPQPRHRGTPIPFMRLAAAKWLEDAKGADELTSAIWGAAYQLSDSEVHRLAGHLAKLLRANNGFCPEYLQHVAEKTGGARGESDPQSEDAPAGVGAAERPGPASGV